MFKCSKCCGVDVYIRYKKYGDEYRGDSGNDEFVTTTYGGYDVTYVRKEHLLCKCNTCEYTWRENTKDSDEN